MAAFPKLVLTSAGIALQTKVQGGATLELTNIQMGSGQLNGQPIGPRTALISSNATVPIQSGQAIGQNTYQVEGFFTNADLSAGFWWREIGIFANDPDNGEILYAYTNAGDAGDYIPTVTDQRIEKYIYFSMTLANATTVTVTIPQTDTYVLQSTVGQANGVAGLGGNGAVPVAQGGTGATTAQGAVVALGALFAIAAAGAYNPEESYAVGDYCTYKGKLRKCSTAIPTGEAWTEAHWTTTTVAAELAELSSQLSNKAASSLGQVPENDLLTWADKQTLSGAFGINPSITTDGVPAIGWYIGKLDVNAGAKKITLTELNGAHRTWTNTTDAGEWTEWVPQANATPPQEFDLPLQSGISIGFIGALNQYSKAQNNLVVISFSVRKTSGYFSSGDSIAILQAGFRPASYAACAAAYSKGFLDGNAVVESDGAVKVYVTSEGAMRVRGNQTDIKQIDGTLLYYADS